MLVPETLAFCFENTDVEDDAHWREVKASLLAKQWKLDIAAAEKRAR